MITKWFILFWFFFNIVLMYQKSTKISKDQWHFLKNNEKSIKISKDQWTFMISLYVTCLWLQRNGGGSRWRKCNRCKTNEKWGFVKVAQMIASHQIRESSGEQGFCVVLMSMRIYKTIKNLHVAFLYPGLAHSSLAHSSFEHSSLVHSSLACSSFGFQKRFSGLSLHEFNLKKCRGICGLY